MDKLEFVVPVRLVPHPDEPVTEIYNIDDALAFLQNWDGDQEGQVYQMTLNHCFGERLTCTRLRMPDGLWPVFVALQVWLRGTCLMPWW